MKKRAITMSPLESGQKVSATSASTVSRQGIVANAALCAPMDGVEITSRDSSGAVQDTTYSDHKGQWRLSNLALSQVVTFSKDGFVQKEISAVDLPDVVRLLEDELIGYQEKLWFLPGDDVTAFVHAPTRFSATLYRHGLVKEMALDLGVHELCRQNIPNGYFVDTGLDWQATFTYQLPLDISPGIYSLCLEADDQERFAIPFIVSTPAEQAGQKSRLLVLASTNTWQSYNLWGGRSRYRNFEDGHSPDYVVSQLLLWRRIKRQIIKFLPNTLIQFLLKLLGKLEPEPWKFKRLSIQRPFTNCNLEDDHTLEPFCNHLAAGEWRLLAWLERQNILYDIVSGYEFHTQPKLLENYRAVIFSTHCEYWTCDMYEQLKYYHEQEKLWIINVSGNTMYRQIEFFEDGSTHCVSLNFDKSCADETQLLGGRFSIVDYGTCAPYKILLPDHWVFDGISKQKKIFGETSLNQNTSKKGRRYDPGRAGMKNGLIGIGASGWEMDKLSKTAPKDIKIVAKGLNQSGGADMLVRDPQERRGGMFSASAICFSGSLLVDGIAATIVQNVITKALVHHPC
ncbi:MAG: carboxypeptidase regulatory-like domain-containing protein [Deltaproteobacteria bacterium]|nr:carboxypeptidase regulatory-like domain-containing protein [Deltaproteobacteria bacterium]